MRHFVAVAEELHFGRAARRLNMAQPPLSQSIGRLEADLGTRLLERSRRGVELTPAGRVFLDQARRTLIQADVARKAAVRAAAAVPEVRVSFVGPALYRVLPELLVRFRAARPGVHVRLFEHASPEQMRGLAAGDFDVGFVTAGVLRDSDCERLLVERALFLAAVPADWPLGADGTITLAELAEQPFIVPPRKYAVQASETLSIFERVGVVPNVTQEATQTNTTVSLVGAGLGCSLVVATAAAMPHRNVRFLRIADDVPQPRWELMMAWRAANLGPLAADFVTFVGDYVRDNPQLLDPHATTV